MSAPGMTAVLGGCGLGAGSGGVTLTLVAADYGDSAANSSEKHWDKLVMAYETEHPGVKVDVTVYSGNDVDRKVEEMAAAGRAPDMAQIGAYADCAAKKGVKFGMVPMPGVDGRSKVSMGVADWMTAFRRIGHAEQLGDFLDFAYSDKNVLAFSREYDLLPVTRSASDAMGSAKRDADLRPFLSQLPLSELYPAGKTSWASVSESVKKRIGSAVAPGGSPSSILSRLQATASTAQSSE